MGFLVKFVNVEVKKDGERVFPNLSFLDFPTSTLRDDFITGMVGKTMAPLKFQKGKTQSMIKKDTVLFDAIKSIKQDIGYTDEDAKKHIVIKWHPKRILEHKGKKVFFQDDKSDECTWFGQFEKFNDGMDTK